MTLNVLRDLSRRLGSRATLIVGAALALLASSPALGQATEWPENPVTLVVGWPPGGGTDILAREVGKHLTEILGQPVIINNRPGAGGVVGASSVARADPDGYTLLFAADAELTIAPVVRKLENFDPIKDLAPVTLVSSGPFMIVANPDFEPATLKELVDYAKQNPGDATYGSFGYGTVGHMLGEHFKSLAGIDTVHVPYQGSAPALVDLVGGKIDYAFFSPMAVTEMIKAGKIKAISMLSSSRLPAVPDVPTSTEGGYPGFEGGPKFGLLAPAGTPQPIIDEIHDAVVKVLDMADVQAFFKARGHLPIGSTPSEYGDFLLTQTDQWRMLADKIGLEPK